ncbi:MAG: methyl-accepting chemotaxis protein [Spirochaetes bacterium]|nr:methyl-accepting chemotaxis protein [Spirochaetota bacterium]
MFGQFVFFLAGLAFMGLLAFPVLRAYKKRIHRLEAEIAKLAGDVFGFRNKAARLAAGVRETAGTISFSRNDDLVSGKVRAGNIENIESTIDENSRISAEIVDKTGSVAAIASKMESDVLQGFAILEKNVKKMKDIKEKNSGVINGIISLSNKVNKIRDIVRGINTITDQTKVIAFNAALEAAGAGETGKRFSVVAGEVNRLADDIAALTRQIREQIEEIMSSSSFLIVHSEESSDRIAEGYKLIKDLEDVFAEIRSGAEITSNQAKTITVSTQKQLKSSEQIYAGIAEISRTVKQLSGAYESAASNVGVLTERSNELERFLTAGKFDGQKKHGN